MLSLCELFVGINSGLLHLAGAVGTPSVGLFGPVDPALRLAADHTHHNRSSHRGTLPGLPPPDAAPALEVGLPARYRLHARPQPRRRLRRRRLTPALWETPL